MYIFRLQSSWQVTDPEMSLTPLLIQDWTHLVFWHQKVELSEETPEEMLFFVKRRKCGCVVGWPGMFLQAQGRGLLLLPPVCTNPRYNHPSGLINSLCLPCRNPLHFLKIVPASSHRFDFGRQSVKSAHLEIHTNDQIQVGHAWSEQTKLSKKI